MRTSLLLGLGAALAFSVSSTAYAQCGSGQTSTIFALNNGQAGNMFDVAVYGTDMDVLCVDVNHQTTGDLLDIEIWTCPTTSVGNESNPLAWTLMDTVSGVVSAGPNAPTQVVLNTPFTLAANTSYGVYVNLANYGTAGPLGYTNGGPNTYNGDHCDITTNCGKGINFGSTFYPREWNGTLHTDAGPAGPSIAVSAGVPGGSMTFDFAGYSAASPIAVLYGQAGSYTAPGGPCAGTTVDLTPLNIQNPIIVLSDANGDAQLTQNVPAAGAGLTVQAADVATCGVSNSIVL